MTKVLWDLDDLWEKAHPEIWHGIPRWDLIFKLKAHIPQLKLTLFASPGLCSEEFLKKWSSYDWVELGLHGWYHTSLECQNWTQAQTDYILDWAAKSGYFKKIFRPPQWVENTPLLKGLKANDWIYAGHPDYSSTLDFHNNGGKIYLAMTKFIVPGVIDGNIKEHGHITEGIANSIDTMFDSWVEKYKDAEFSFITEEVEKIYGNKDFFNR